VGVLMSLGERIKNRAKELGFASVGITAAITPPGMPHLLAWLDRGFAGEMAYMKRQAAAREHPRHLLEQVRSVILVALNYRTADPAPTCPSEGRISRYAWGKDYHDVMRGRLRILGDFLHSELPGCRTRPVVDSAPILERDFAQLAGLGWIGKNTMLINKQLGSWTFLGALLTDAELEYDNPHATNHCGTCTRCLDACPTDAFNGPFQLDSRRCISYLTIELRGPIPNDLRSGMGNWLFGCDICQDVCPWNRKAPRTTISEFEPRQASRVVDLAELVGMSDESLCERISGTALTRTGLNGLRRNPAIALGNGGDSSALPALQQLVHSTDAGVREAARWAIDQIQVNGTRHEQSVIQADS
jgi:epoxyqueuosine reductase